MSMRRSMSSRSMVKSRMRRWIVWENESE
jgi:hypothetical protein